MSPTIQQTSIGAVRHLLARAVPFDVGGSQSLEALTAGCAIFAVSDESGPVGAFSLECLTDQSGTVIHVTAAGGLPGHDIAGSVAAFVESEARHRVKARAVRCETRRRGLVKRLEREGWKVAGFIIQKDIE